MTNVNKAIVVKSFNGSPEGYGTIAIELSCERSDQTLINIEFEDGLLPRPQVIAINSPQLGNMTAEALKAYADNADYIHGLIRSEILELREQVSFEDGDYLFEQSRRKA